MNKKPHKHAELIKAWADGAEIEYRRCDEDTWIEVGDPEFYENLEYRIKPESEPVAPATPYAEVFRALADGVPLSEFEYSWPDEDNWNVVQDYQRLGSIMYAAYLIRRKQRTININGLKVPEPLRELENGQRVWVASPIKSTNSGKYASQNFINCDDLFYQERLRSGLLHATEEAADLHGRALASFTEVKE